MSANDATVGIEWLEGSMAYGDALATGEGVAGGGFGGDETLVGELGALSGAATGALAGASFFGHGCVG